MGALLAGCSSQAASEDPSPTETSSAQVTSEPSPTETTDSLTISGEAGGVEESEAAEEPATEPSQADTSESEPTNSPSKAPRPKPTPEETVAAESSPEPTVTTGPVGYTSAEVAQNDSQSSCWVIVDGSVYDLTKWIAQHPGGSGAILNLCGTDASSAFDSQHGGQSRPSNVLDGYFMGPLIK